MNLDSARRVAGASATAYVTGIINEGADPSDIDTRQAFIDGFMTAIESLLAHVEHLP